MTIDDFRREWFDSKDYIVCHTSGSTGNPKEIKLSKADMRKSAQATIEFFGLDDNLRYVCPISLDYIGGKMMAVRSFVGKGILDVISPSNTFSFEGTADLLAVVPSQIPNIIECFNKDQIRHLIIGGAPLSQENRLKLAKTGIDSWLTYGMTETASHVALARVSEVTEPVFTALPGIYFSLDHRGCLVIERHGYEQERIITNDLVDLFTPTSFAWLGRADNVINSGGIKVIPERIEEKIIEFFPDLEGHIVIRSKGDEKWGSVPELVIDLDYETDSVIKCLLSVIDPRICPKTVVKVEKIERTPNGKIIR